MKKTISLISVIAASHLFLISPVVMAKQFGQDPPQSSAYKILAKESLIHTDMKLDKRTNTPSFLKLKVKANLTKGVENSARQFMGKYRSLYKITDVESELATKEIETTTAGGHSVLFKQRYKGLDVFGHELRVQISADGFIEQIGGKFLPGIELSEQPSMPGNKAQSVAENDLRLLTNNKFGRVSPSTMFGVKLTKKQLEMLGADKVQTIKLKQAPKLTIVDKGLLENTESDARLSWQMSFIHSESAAEWIYFVDANTGEVILKYNNTKDFLNRNTYTANNLFELPGDLLIPEGGSSSDVIAQSMHDHMGIVYDYYNTEFTRDSIDNLGMTLVSTVHYGENYNNAFWNGEQMAFGDGDGYSFAPFGNALDIVSHEFTHGVTSNEADLIYAGESGALNEAFSDILGELNESHHAAGIVGEWLLGEDAATPHITGDALRSMISPMDYGQPDHYLTIIKAPINGFDNGGVHLNSGIANKAAYLIAKGGNYNGYSITGIGNQNTEQLFYALLSQHLNTGSNYHDLSILAIQEAESRFGANSPELDAVQITFEALGLGSDSDNDGLPDSVENLSGIYDPAQKTSSTGTDNNNEDTDVDGISDGNEVTFYHTNPLNTDTDGDGISDSSEVSLLSDPAVSSSSPSPGWSADQVIAGNSASTNGAFNPEITVDSNGNVTATWLESEGLGWAPWAGRYNEALGWHDIQQIGDVGGIPNMPEIASDNAGNVVVVWLNYIDGDNRMRSTIKARTFTASQGWSATDTVHDGTACAFADMDIVARNGKAFLAWQECTDDTIESVRVLGTTFDFSTGWDTPVRINTGFCEQGTNCIPKVAMDDQGNGLVLWTQLDTTTGNQAIYFNHIDATNGWALPARLNNEPESATQPGIVMDTSGNAIAVWQQRNGMTNQLLYAQYNNGTWQTENAVVANNNSSMISPRIAMNNHGQAVLAWNQTEGLGYNIYASLFDPFTGWLPPTQLENEKFGRASGTASHSVSINEHGNVIVTWIQIDYHFNRLDVWSKHYFQATGWMPNKIIESSLTSAHFVESAPFVPYPIYMYPTAVIGNDNVSVSIWLQKDKERLTVTNLVSNVSKAPSIDEFAPETGVVGTGGSVIGSNFCINECYTSNSTETTVTVNGVELDLFWVSPTAILFYIPEGVTTGPITVTTAAGSSVSSTDLVVVPPPQIDDFAPESGTVGTGGSIIGSNFCVNECYTLNSTETKATVNGIELDLFWVSPTVILFYIPEGMSTGSITVTNPAGSATTSTELVVTN